MSGAGGLSALSACGFVIGAGGADKRLSAPRPGEWSPAHAVSTGWRADCLKTNPGDLPQPAHPRAEVRAAVGIHAGPHDLRAAGCCRGPRRTLDEARDDILAFIAFPREVWRQIWSSNPRGTAGQGDPPPHRRRRDLPVPRLHHPPRRHGARRAERRVDRIPPLHGAGNPCHLPESGREKRRSCYLS
jgi:hypothetical protein